jgi:hypothetical protein
MKAAVTWTEITSPGVSNSCFDEVSMVIEERPTL